MKHRAIGLLFATLVGCGSGAGAPTGGAESVDSTGACAQPEDAVAPPAGLEATAALGDSHGRAVRASLMLRNGGKESVEIWSSARRYDAWVVDAGGSVVWLWSHERAQRGEVFQDYLRRQLLAPNAEIEAELSWDGATCEGGMAPSGDYTFRGMWSVMRSEDGPSESWWTPPVDFSLD